MIHGGVQSMLLVAAWKESASVWGRFDNQRATFGTHEKIIICAVALLLTGVLIWQMIARRRQREFWLNSAPRLFRELCRAHRLDRSSRRLLKRLAAARGVKTPAHTFVEPKFFDTTNLPSELKSSASELRQLRHRLFD